MEFRKSTPASARAAKPSASAAIGDLAVVGWLALLLAGLVLLPLLIPGLIVFLLTGSGRAARFASVLAAAVVAWKLRSLWRAPGGD